MLESRQLKIRSLNTEWLEKNSKGKTILLLLHGFPDDASVWVPFTAKMRGDYHVIAPMLRGSGKSEKSQDLARYSPESLALDIFAILKKADPAERKKVVIIGHDIGGILAWYVATLLEKRLKNLVIINAASMAQASMRITNPRQIVKSWYIFLFLIPGLAELLFACFSKPLLGLAKKLGGLNTGGHEVAQTSGTLPFYRAAFFSFINNHDLRQPARIKAPVIVIHGKKDAFVEPATLRELNSFAESVELRVVEGNHWLQIEHPERLAGLIKEFIHD